MKLPIVPALALLLVFGVPYLVIYLQSRRLARLEDALRALETAVRSGRNGNA